jgi:hypothetical protein
VPYDLQIKNGTVVAFFRFMASPNYIFLKSFSLDAHGRFLGWLKIYNYRETVPDCAVNTDVDTKPAFIQSVQEQRMHML